MDVSRLRSRLGSGRRPLTQAGFARLVGADVRSVARWERACDSTGGTRPTGCPKEVIVALSAFLDGHPERESDLAELVAGYVDLGGLAVMLVDLLERKLLVPSPDKGQNPEKL